MRLPDRLASLVDEGIIQEVVRPLMSGKEAQVYVVVAGGKERVAKVYKEAHDRTFRQRAEYAEGRRVRNTRDQRAMDKHTRYGRAKDEEAWRTAEVDIIYRLRAAGVRVPAPYQFIDGVLIMEMITDAEGHPAPRLAEVALTRDEARGVFDVLLREVVKMLCAGVVHGDLSDFNVLLAPDGPVVIDFPQAVDPSRNQNARQLLVRDVDNLVRFLGRFDPGVRRLPYAYEMWDRYRRAELTPDTVLTGRHRTSRAPANVSSLLGEIAAAESDEQRRREALGAAPRAPRKREVVMAPGGGRRDDRASQGRRGPGGQRSDGRPGPNGRPRAEGARAPNARREEAQVRRDDAPRGAAVPRTPNARREEAQVRRDDASRGAAVPRTPNARREEARRDDAPRGAAVPRTEGRDPSIHAHDAASADAPRKRRRRRRKKGPGDAQNATVSNAAPSVAIGGAADAPRSEASASLEGAPKKRRRRRRRKPAGAAPQSES